MLLLRNDQIKKQQLLISIIYTAYSNLNSLFYSKVLYYVGFTQPFIFVFTSQNDFKVKWNIHRDIALDQGGEMMV